MSLCDIFSNQDHIPVRCFLKFSFVLTTSDRPSLQAFWKRACLSSWGRSLKPVYLIWKGKQELK